VSDSRSLFLYAVFLKKSDFIRCEVLDLVFAEDGEDVIPANSFILLCG